MTYPTNFLQLNKLALLPSESYYTIKTECETLVSGKTFEKVSPQGGSPKSELKSSRHQLLRVLLSTFSALVL